jgi:hypothetical protein
VETRDTAPSDGPVFINVPPSLRGGLRLYGEVMSRQALGNALAGVLFFIIAIVDFTRDSSGIGVVFLVFAAVFLGLAFSARKTASS